MNQKTEFPLLLEASLPADVRAKIRVASRSAFVVRRRHCFFTPLELQAIEGLLAKVRMFYGSVHIEL